MVLFFVRCQWFVKEILQCDKGDSDGIEGLYRVVRSILEYGVRGWLFVVGVWYVRVSEELGG